MVQAKQLLGWLTCLCPWQTVHSILQHAGLLLGCCVAHGTQLVMHMHHVPESMVTSQGSWRGLVASMLQLPEPEPCPIAIWSHAFAFAWLQITRPRSLSSLLLGQFLPQRSASPLLCTRAALTAAPVGLCDSCSVVSSSQVRYGHAAGRVREYVFLLRSTSPTSAISHASLARRKSASASTGKRGMFLQDFPLRVTTGVPLHTLLS